MLLAGLPFPAEELAFGHTKVFIRSPRTVSLGMGESRGDPNSSWEFLGDATAPGGGSG